MSPSPRIVCVACSTREVGIYELLCAQCRPLAAQMGLVEASPTPPAAEPDQRIQVGPTDI
jgi:hypothetical protein